MATFTMALWEVIELEGRDNIGLSDYPIFDEAHRKILNDKIIDYYYNREIGQETISQFRLALKRKMNNLMPLFNQHYELSKIKLDALSTVDMKNTGNSTTLATGNSENTTENATKVGSVAVASQFPQNRLRDGGDYATNSQENTSDSDSKATSADTQTSNQQGNTETTMTGYQGHQPGLIYAARQAIVNIDLDVIESLETLFMGIWNTDEEYSRNGNYYYDY